jgi:hypothetical protein
MVVPSFISQSKSAKTVDEVSLFQADWGLHLKLDDAILTRFQEGLLDQFLCDRVNKSLYTADLDLLDETV